MTQTNFTLIDEARPLSLLAALAGDRVRIDPEALRTELGWELKPQGLCKDDRCVPVKDRAEFITDDGVDLERFAAALHRPLALDVDARMACMGVPAADRIAAMASLNAPDFTLPDWQGRTHSLSDYRGKKVLLVAYASW